MSANIEIKIGKKVVDTKKDKALLESIKSFIETKKELDLQTGKLKTIKDEICSKAKFF